MLKTIIPKSKIAYTALALCTSFVLASCGGGNSTKTQPPKTTTTSQSYDHTLRKNLDISVREFYRDGNKIGFELRVMNWGNTAYASKLMGTVIVNRKYRESFSINLKNQRIIGNGIGTDFNYRINRPTKMPQNERIIDVQLKDLAFY